MTREKREASDRRRVKGKESEQRGEEKRMEREKE